MNFIDVGWKATLSVLLSVFFVTWVEPTSKAGSYLLFVVAFLVTLLLVTLISKVVAAVHSYFARPSIEEQTSKNTRSGDGAPILAQSNNATVKESEGEQTK